MSSFESFYGGRQGASFVIVKRFDGLDIEENSLYRVGWYAKDANDYFYVPLIEKTADNYADYPGWGSIPKDGVTTVTSQSGVVSTPLEVEYAEGMKQCFEKGGATASEVGYGEYVIIDTIFGLGEQSNPDNGKVYRRGMNYDEDLGGAEYIGQIVGPRGKSPELDMTTIEDILSHTGSQVREYDMTDGDAEDGIVPGKYLTKSGNIAYNDEITYGWTSVRDDHGNVTGALIGFTFPYLVPEITGTKRSPYYTQEDLDEGRITDANLIGTPILDSHNFVLFVDNGYGTEDRDPTHGDTGHAFFRRWKLAVPHGIKGDTQTQLEIVPTKIREFANLWGSTDTSLAPVATADKTTYVILDDAKFEHDCVYPYDDTSVVVAAKKESVPGVTYYAKIDDTYMLKTRYRQTWYDAHEDGRDYEMITLGDYNTIRKVWLTDDGWLWASYNSDEDNTLNENSPIQWYKGVDVLRNGTVVFTYNTVEDDGVTHKKQTFDKALDWVESVALANIDNPIAYDPQGTNVNAGHFRVIFNNDSVANQTGTWTDASGVTHAIWETDITWPKSVSLTSEGLLKFLYNNNLYYDPSIYTDPTEGSYSFEIPWITSALIAQDGTFTLSYNNEVNAGVYPASEWDSTTHTWTKVLNFIDHVTIDEDGKIHFWYSNGTEADNTGYANIRIKYLVDAEVRTGLVKNSQYDFEGEGTGDQKIQLTWNTETIAGTKDVSVVGAPLNYIMETIVTTYDPNAPSTPQNHLLVLYSDPTYRNWLKNKYSSSDKKKNKIWSYTSQKFSKEDPATPYLAVTPAGTENPSAEGWYELNTAGRYVLTADTTVDTTKTYYKHNIIFITRDDWFDLGYVKGEPGGLHIIGEYTLQSGETYRDYLDDTIPPEDMPGNTSEDRGWAYLVVSGSGAEVQRTIYTYDYVHSKWVVVSDLTASFIEPPQVVIMDGSKIDSETGLVIPEDDAYITLPRESGLWFVETKIKAAY